MAHDWIDNGFGLDECECQECKTYWACRLAENDLTDVFKHIDEINAKLGPGGVCLACETLLDIDEDGNFSCECSKKYMRENTLLARIILSRGIRGWDPPMFRYSTIDRLTKYLQVHIPDTVTSEFGAH